jgi:hypothetical protein
VEGERLHDDGKERGDAAGATKPFRQEWDYTLISQHFTIVAIYDDSKTREVRSYRSHQSMAKAEYRHIPIQR